jgi:hypothetical protein
MPCSDSNLPSGFVVLPSGLLVPAPRETVLATDLPAITTGEVPPAVAAIKKKFEFSSPTPRGRR